LYVLLIQYPKHNNAEGKYRTATITKFLSRSYYRRRQISRSKYRKAIIAEGKYREAIIAVRQISPQGKYHKVSIAARQNIKILK
jgi:hypothetical protein